MMRPRFSNERGFTLVETYVALALSGAFLMSVVSAWYYSTKMWKEETVRTTMRVNVERGMERLKEDVRLTDYNEVLFYPSTAPYTAISLPRAIPNSSGYLNFSSNQISWDETVIYHVYDNAGTAELRRTVISGFNANDTGRQTDLNTAATTGTVPGAQTRALCKGTGVTLELTPQNPEFDGYSATTTRSPLTTFGTATLSSGIHEVRFEVTGKNASSSGYRMGIDSLTLSPSGGSREAEALTLSDSSGEATSVEDMSGYSGLWGGNHQRYYASGAAGDYFELDVPYDQWLESNFANMTHSNTEVTGANPVLQLSSRETQGASPNWLASSQTASGTQGSFTLSARQSIRTVVLGTSVGRAANMARLKFTAGAGGGMTINSAYFGVRSGSEALGNGTADYSGVPVQLYFDNAPLPESAPDPAGAVGAGSATSVTLAAGEKVWTNWFEYGVTYPAPDYLVSMNVSSGGQGQTWTETGSPPVHSYRIDDSTGLLVDDAGWSVLPGYSSHDYTFGAVELGSWLSTGTATSQVYDTALVSPGYVALTWTASLPAGATVQTKVRTSANADMTGASSWALLTPYTVSPSSLSGLPPQRYVQFQTTLTGASPFTTYPTMDDLSITWPGATTLVALSGHFTMKSDYGKFRVLVDGVPTVKELEIDLTVTQEYRGQNYSFTLRGESKPRNTGK